MGFFDQETIFTPSLPPVSLTEKHLPCVLLLDTSGSMQGEPIQELNKGIACFKETAMKDGQALKSLESAIVTFHDTATVNTGFAPIADLNIPVLEAGGLTALGTGIQTALDLIQERKDVYKQIGTPYFRAWLFLISDGEPTDDYSQAALRLKKECDAKKILFFAIGVGEYNREILAGLSPDSRVIEMRDLDFSTLFEWLSSSLSQTTRSKPGEILSLPPAPSNVLVVEV
jgi:uncharacterized protein YegL